MILNQTTKKIIKQAVDYEIEKNEQLYQKLQDLRKCGGTAAMKAYWKEFHLRADAYEHIITSEIKLHVQKSMKSQLMQYLYALIVINLSVAIFVLIFLAELTSN